MGLSYRDQLILKSLGDDLRNAVKEKTAYNGTDEELLNLKKLFGMPEAESTINSIVDDFSNELEGINEQRIQPYLSGMDRDGLMSHFQNRLTGISQANERLAEYFRTKTNEMEENRAKTEAALKAQKEQLDNAMEQVTQVSEATTDAVKKAAEMSDDLKKKAEEFGVDFGVKPAEKEPVAPQEQQTMQQAAPQSAQANPPVEQPPAPPPPQQGQPPAGGQPPTPDMGGQSPAGGPPPSPDMGGQPPAPDMGGQPPAGGAPDDGMFTPPPGMINAISSPFGA